MFADIHELKYAKHVFQTKKCCSFSANHSSCCSLIPRGHSPLSHFDNISLILPVQFLVFGFGTLSSIDNMFTNANKKIICKPSPSSFLLYTTHERAFLNLRLMLSIVNPSAFLISGEGVPKNCRTQKIIKRSRYVPMEILFSRSSFGDEYLQLRTEVTTLGCGHFKHERPCFTTFQTRKRVENTTPSRVFWTNFKLFVLSFLQAANYKCLID